VCNHRDLPFARDKARKKEQVRPVHWANKPESYVARTANWDDFPNGRWGGTFFFFFLFFFFFFFFFFVLSF
jgi:hypothetical protein